MKLLGGNGLGRFMGGGIGIDVENLDCLNYFWNTDSTDLPAGRQVERITRIV